MNHFHLSCTNVLCIRRDQERQEWYLSPPLFFICLLCTDCLCLHGTCAVVTIITTSNLSRITICDPKLLAAPSGICNIDTIAERTIAVRNKSNTLQHVEIVECFVKTKLFDRHFEPAVSPTRVPAPGEWLSSVQSRSKLRKCCGCCRNVPTMQLTLRFAGLLTNKCDFINKRTFRHHNKLTQLDWLDSVKYL